MIRVCIEITALIWKSSIGFRSVRYILKRCGVCRASAQPSHLCLLVLFSFYGQANSALPLGDRLALDGWCLVSEITTVSLKVKSLFCMPLTLFDILENCLNVLRSTYYRTRFRDSATNSSSAAVTLSIYINCLWWQEITMYKRYGLWCTDTQFIFQKFSSLT